MFAGLATLARTIPKIFRGKPDLLLESINKFNVAHAIDHYQNNRQKYYEELSTFDTFGKGWTRRVEETTKLALEL